MWIYGARIQKKKEPRVHCFYYGGVCPFENNKLKDEKLKRTFDGFKKVNENSSSALLREEEILKATWYFNWEQKITISCIW